MVRLTAGFGAAAVALGQAYLNAQAREVGGDNKGPWVCHVCRGFSVAWCQGFASTLYAQAAQALGEESWCSMASGVSTCHAW